MAPAPDQEWQSLLVSVLRWRTSDRVSWLAESLVSWQDGSPLVARLHGKSAGRRLFYEKTIRGEVPFMGRGRSPSRETGSGINLATPDDRAGNRATRSG